MSFDSKPVQKQEQKKEDIKIPEDAPTIGSEWRHFKSLEMKYRVLDIIFDADTDVWKVLYGPLYESQIKKFSRSIKGWNDTVSKDDYNGPRFIKLKD